MSHYYMIAILPKDTHNVEKRIEEMVAPYDENKDVPEYDRTCWCIRQSHDKAVTEAAEKELGSTWKQLRESFGEIRKSLPKPTKKNFEKFWALEQAAWKKHTKPLLDLEKKYDTQFPSAPVSDCPECKGTGTYRSTYNPKSKWDWYRVGGRWDGTIQQKESQRRDKKDGGFNFADEHEQVVHNWAPIKHLLRIKEIPFGIITPDGEWHERATMGFWAMTSDDKDKDVWEREVMDIYTKYQGDFIGVGLDCHI